MLPTALETDGTCLTRTSPSTPDCKAACLFFLTQRSPTPGRLCAAICKLT